MTEILSKWHALVLCKRCNNFTVSLRFQSSRFGSFTPGSDVSILKTVCRRSVISLIKNVFLVSWFFKKSIIDFSSTDEFCFCRALACSYEVITSEVNLAMAKFSSLFYLVYLMFPVSQNAFINFVHLVKVQWFDRGRWWRGWNHLFIP